MVSEFLMTTSILALLYQCNDLIQPLAGKYLTFGYMYKGMSSSGLNAEQMVDSMDDYEHYHNNSDDDNNVDFDTGESNTKEIESALLHDSKNSYHASSIAKLIES
jgi:hypothetical protein